MEYISLYASYTFLLTFLHEWSLYFLYFLEFPLGIQN